MSSILKTLTDSDFKQIRDHLDPIDPGYNASEKWALLL